MKRLVILLLITFSSLQQANSQSISAEEANVKSVINNLFEGMRTTDSVLIRKAFAVKSIMQTIATTKEGKASVRTENVDQFIKSVGTSHPGIYDERIDFTNIMIDGNLASVWTNYKFYIGGSSSAQNGIEWKFSHCGVNSFQLLKGDDGWKIIYLIDTRRKDNCNN